MNTKVAGPTVRSWWSRVWNATTQPRFLSRPIAKSYSFLDSVTFLNGVAEQSMPLPMPEFVHTLNNAKKQLLARNAVHLEQQLEAAILLVKITNLLITKYEYRHRRIQKFAKPIGFMLDPFNACQLGCPTCQNSSNREYVRRTYKTIPMATMKPDMFAAFIDDMGPTAFIGHFYNNHEPLLNNNTPAFIRRANDYRIDTLVSSNLSIPRLDAEAVVTSGLQTLMVAADGVTQGSYARYRRGGDVELVFDNVRCIAEAKRRLGRKRPYLRWQYLTFEHNLHEIERAIELAPTLGFDCFNLATPYDVSSDEPTVRAVEYPGPDSHKSLVFAPDPGLEFDGSLEPMAERIHALLHEDVEARFHAHASVVAEDTVSAARGSSMCDWLHLGMVVDAAGRVGTCCISDFQRAGRIYVGSLAEDGRNVYNSKLFLAARTLLARPEEYAAHVGGLPASERPFCDGCTNRPRPQVGLGATQYYLQRSRSLAGAPSTVLEALGGWSEHDSGFAPAPPSSD